MVVPRGSSEARRRGVVARVAVGLAAAVVVVVAAAYAVFSVALVAGGDDAVSDNWVGILAGVALLGGLVVSLVALVLAVVARRRRERWRWLWLPLALFPALLAFTVLAELFVVE